MQTDPPFQTPSRKRALVIGAYGLIGSACARALMDAGMRVSGLARDSSASAVRAAPEMGWYSADVGETSVEDWRKMLLEYDQFDVIVNASGVLQDGAGDSLEAVHVTAIERMTEALRGTDTLFVQISAVGADPATHTNFLRTKGRGDAILAASDLDWVILRPGLVLSPQAFGGTAMLRAAASFPGVEPRLFEETRIQTVSVKDVAQAVVRVAQGEIPLRQTYDLVEESSHTLPEIVAKFRTWQGHDEPRFPQRAPKWALWAFARGADALGDLGWRSPMRTTALRVLQTGVTADPAPWREVNGTPCRSLDQTLARMPSTVQERWFASLYFLIPLAIGTLSLFWLLSGLIALAQNDAARTLLTERGVSGLIAWLVVFGGAVIDIVLGVGILIRKHAKTACAGMIAVSLAYLLGGTLFAPDLWIDPIGPLVKVLPSIVLTLFVRALLENR